MPEKPALDVVHERLRDDCGLGDIVVQIDDPRTDREKTINKIIDIEGNEFVFASDPVLVGRDTLCHQIAEDERECKKFLDNNSYSIRGDLRAKIFRVEDETGFNAHRSEAFVSDIKQNIGSPTDRDKSASWKMEIRELVKCWKNCNYMENPWHFIAEEWNIDKIPSLRGECKELEDLFSFIVQRRNSLPAKNFLNIAESPLMTKYSHVFFEGEQRETVRLLCQLISGTRRLFFKFCWDERGGAPLE